MAEPAHFRLDRSPREGRHRPSGGRAIAPDGTLLAGAASLPLIARRIAHGIAAHHADSVDSELRFPTEAVAALRSAGLLGAAVPIRLGGHGADFRTIVACCYELGQGCSNTAMVFAMHQIQVLCLVRHAMSSPWHQDFLSRLARDQLLLASATTEAGSGGDVRRSECAITNLPEGVALTKSGCVISYAEQCDAILATARRTPDSAPSDQVSVLAERSQFRLQHLSSWDTLGMRGTCSHSYKLELEVDRSQIVPDTYAEIAARTMLPVSHVTWAASWLGIATAACSRARAAVRRRTVIGASGPAAGSLRLSEALAQLQALRAQVAEAARRFEAVWDDVDTLTSIPFALGMNHLKVAVSTGAIDVVGQALLVAGLSGYRTDSPDSIGRHLRDIHSAALMIGNDRITSNCATLLGAYRGEEDLFQ